MKSLVKKTKSTNKTDVNKVRASAKSKPEATTKTTRTEAQCCAKVSKTAVGCHD